MCERFSIIVINLFFFIFVLKNIRVELLVSDKYVFFV